MPRTCTICNHPQRLKIEQALVAGTALRTISGQFGPSKTAVLRHRTHVTEAIARSAIAHEAVRSGVLLDDVRAGEGRAERLYQQAEEILSGALQDKDRRTALQAIRAAVDVMGEARSYLELRGELTNELGRDRTSSSVAIQIVCPAAAGAQSPVTFGNEADGYCEIGLSRRP